MNTDLALLSQKLTEEIALLEKLTQHHEGEVVRRLYIRSAFAFLEAFACLMREKATQALIAQHIKTPGIPITKLCLLDDCAYVLTDTGQIQRKERSPHPFVPYFAFTLRTLAEAAQVPENYIQGPGWDSFKKAVRIRNRVTHPKKSEDIIVSEADSATVYSALKWTVNSCIDIGSRSPVLKSDTPVPPKMR